ncbi:MAG TPA: S8/S53 family peptidase [Bacteroidales bacterium]|nr:S8/S53 family peptidase [Bacteroidales bacterium]
MRRTIIILLITAAPALFAQEVADQAYWLYFTDKNNNSFSVNEPYDYLSQRSLERRGWQNLPVTERDLPVTGTYLDSLRNLGLEIKHRSKWLNGALVITEDTLLMDTIYTLSFIDSIMWTPNANNVFYPDTPTGNRFEPAHTESPGYRYGFSEEQISIMNLDYLHNKGYTGRGVIIAVLDAGFIEMDSLTAFDTTYAKNRVLHTKNLVNRLSSVYGDHPHGTYVSSLIVANWPDTLIGSAPDAQLILATTENVASETRVEEFAWIEGAEWADSLGADIINTSLGYTVFDDSLTNHTYEDMDGKTAHISIANSMTADRGMISVTSAGNAGNEEWYYMGAPADAENIISAGAVDNSGNIAGFSSRGPTYDSRIKPELMAMGSGTYIQGLNGLAQGGGTSFSAPLLSGGVATLWQAYPTMPAKEMIRWLLESGDRYEEPDTDYGFGIPSFSKAFHAITPVKVPVSLRNMPVELYPNPTNGELTVRLAEKMAGNYTIKLMNISGSLIYSQQVILPGTIIFPPDINTGIYIIQISNNKFIFNSRIIRN